MRASQHARRRARQRGATLLIVLLVLTLLVGIGAFTARSSQLATVSSGHVRHQTQARYVGEYGLMMVTSVLSGSGGQSYLSKMGHPADQCTGQSSVTNPTCLKIGSNDVNSELVTGGSFNLCEPASPNAYAGSLGMAEAECRFAVELTDKMQGYTPSGFDTAGPVPLKFFYVTATVTAQVLLKDPANSNSNALTQMQLQSSNTQTLRSRILAGPYPASL